MAEYIDREVLLLHIKDLPTWWEDDGGVYCGSMKYPDGSFDCEDVVSSIENAPAADVAPVKHGRWIGYGEEVRCSECGCHPLKEMNRGVVYYWKYEPPYCPNCGAKMDLEGV